MRKVLLAVGMGLVIGAVFTMPGILIALKPFLGNTKVSRQSLQKTYNALARRKFVKVRKEGDTYILEITKEGRKQRKEYQLKESIAELKISPPKTWDRKWRLVVFDIPEFKKQTREALRALLNNLGFYKLQDSVFIHPFECEHEVDLLTELFEIGKYVYCFTVESEKVPSSVAYHFSRLLSKYM